MDGVGNKSLEALLHHVNVIFSSDANGNIGREQELENINQCTRLAERIVNGAATDEDMALVRDLIHPQIRSTYNL